MQSNLFVKDWVIPQELDVHIAFSHVFCFICSILGVQYVQFERFIASNKVRQNSFPGTTSFLAFKRISPLKCHLQT